MINPIDVTKCEEVPGPTPEVRRCGHTLGRWRCVLAHGHREAHQLEKAATAGLCPTCHRMPHACEHGFGSQPDCRSKPVPALHCAKCGGNGPALEPAFRQDQPVAHCRDCGWDTFASDLVPAQPDCRSEPRADCGFVHELESQLSDRAGIIDGLQRALAAANRERDEAERRAKAAEENWKASQREAEALGRMLAGLGMGVA